MSVLFQHGVGAALGAAALFGAGAPFAKPLLAHASPWLLAGLLYLGSGVGLSIWRVVSRAPAVRLQRAEVGWLAGAVIAGGMLGPLLLMTGLAGMAAADASLLLNAEGVLTALIAWFAFKENFDRRIALGMLVIVAGAVMATPRSIYRLHCRTPRLPVHMWCLRGQDVTHHRARETRESRA